ncbi:MAG: chorismate mutase [Chthoniobacterales bacterium]|nr:chorismate mutase [Chthoniobacterales bacterium]
MSCFLEKIERFRSQIDRIDEQLLELLNERAQLAMQIGKLKEHEGLAAFVPDREELLMRKILNRNTGPLSPVALRSIFREIITASLGLEGPFRIAAASWKEEAATLEAIQTRFGNGVEVRKFRHPNLLLESLFSGECQCVVGALLSPQEISPALELLAISNTLCVCSEIRISAEGKRFLLLRTGESRIKEDAEIFIWSREVITGNGIPYQLLKEFSEGREIQLLGAISLNSKTFIFAETSRWQKPSEQTSTSSCFEGGWKLRGAFLQNTSALFSEKTLGNQTPS